ncbi:MAG: hypothetical protein IT280_02265 [Ignavibacteria bacterium]|nr:hypothetical protein [Ignavibacteria bacterium]
MKLILSRKGFDSSHGGQPSPILPDGTLLSFPIPSKEDKVKYTELFYNDTSYFELITQLNNKTKIKSKYTCHLDPDIRRENLKRLPGWKPLFGQQGGALSHLFSQGVSIGDMFIFFGWFRQTELIGSILKYEKNAPDLNVIFGYLQIGNIFHDVSLLPKEYLYHPHSNQKKYKKNNCIFESSESLDFLPGHLGANTLNFHNKLILTKEGFSRSKWQLPDIFKDIEISHHNNSSWKNGYFQSCSIGQEFVFDANDQVLDWAKNIIK